MEVLQVAGDVARGVARGVDGDEDGLRDGAVSFILFESSSEILEDA